MNPKLYIGSVAEEAGRLSEVAYPDLYAHLLELGFAFVPVKPKYPSKVEPLGTRWRTKSLRPKNGKRTASGLGGCQTCACGAMRAL